MANIRKPNILLMASWVDVAGVDDYHLEIGTVDMNGLGTGAVADGANYQNYLDNAGNSHTTIYDTNGAVANLGNWDTKQEMLDYIVNNFQIDGNFKLYTKWTTNDGLIGVSNANAGGADDPGQDDGVGGWVHRYTGSQPTSMPTDILDDLTASENMVLILIEDNRVFSDTNAGNPSPISATGFEWVFRCNDVGATRQLEISYDYGVTWWVIVRGLGDDFQNCLDTLALFYPTEEYEAGLGSDGFIHVQPSTGVGAGTITFNQQFQELLNTYVADFWPPELWYEHVPIWLKQ